MDNSDPSFVQLSLQVHPNTWKKAAQLAEELGLSVSEYFTKLVMEDKGQETTGPETINL